MGLDRRGCALSAGPKARWGSRTPTTTILAATELLGDEAQRGVELLAVVLAVRDDPDLHALGHQVELLRGGADPLALRVRLLVVVRLRLVDEDDLSLFDLLQELDVLLRLLLRHASRVATGADGGRDDAGHNALLLWLLPRVIPGGRGEDSNLSKLHTRRRSYGR